MIPGPQNPDARIDHVLNALRTTEPPAGLEARLAARLANATEARPATNSFFAVILNAVKDPCISLAKTRLYTVAAALTLLLTITTITLFRHRTPSATAQSKPIPSQPNAPAQQPTSTQAPSEPSTQSSSETGIHAPQPVVLANTQVPQGFSLASHNPPKSSGVLAPPPADPDAIALAETLAPSRPAPPMPLTPQERLLLSATRQGQPLEMAELEPLRESAFRSIVEARQHATVRQYIQALLGPLAAAQAINSPSPLPDEAQSAAPSDPPASK